MTLNILPETGVIKQNKPPTCQRSIITVYSGSPTILTDRKATIPADAHTILTDRKATIPADAHTILNRQKGHNTC